MDKGVFYTHTQLEVVTTMEQSCLVTAQSGKKFLDWVRWRELLPLVGPEAASLALLVAYVCHARPGSPWQWRVTEAELAAELGVNRDTVRSYLNRLVDAGLLARPQRGVLLALPALLRDEASGPPDALAEVVPLRAVSGEPSPRPPSSADFFGTGGLPPYLEREKAALSARDFASRCMHTPAIDISHAHASNTSAHPTATDSRQEVLAKLEAIGWSNPRKVEEIASEPDRALACLNSAQRKTLQGGNTAGLFHKMFFVDRDFPAPGSTTGVEDPVTSEQAGMSRAQLAAALADVADADSNLYQELTEAAQRVENPGLFLFERLKQEGYLT